MINKIYCMSSYLAFRYIENTEANFFSGMKHKIIPHIPQNEKIPVKTADDIDLAIAKQMQKIRNKKKGIMLSGGMDSAILASYMSGSDAYTFRFPDGFQSQELKNAQYYAKFYNLKLHYVDINWNTVKKFLLPVMKAKCAPVHSIEPQILQAALQAKNDGIELMIIGESSDLIFGGMDKLLSKDWTFDEFMERYIFTKPEEILESYENMKYLFDRYRIGDNIDFLSFMNDVFSIESSSSYYNAFSVAKIDYFDPYAKLIMADKLDLHRVRTGEPKYLIRELMAKKYPNIQIPNKVPMPRPVDSYFKNWKGPIRPEFRKDIKMEKYSGDQKWQMYCLEEFLNHFDPLHN